MPEEIVVSDRHMSDTEKIHLNWRLDSIVKDYVLLISIAIPFW